MTLPSSMPDSGLQADLFANLPPVLPPKSGKGEARSGAVEYRGLHDRRVSRLANDIRRAEHCDEIRRLEPVAVVVGFGRLEFTLADVRTEAERIGILTGHEGRPDPKTGRMQQPRALAFLGALLPGLARIGFVLKVEDALGRTVYATSDRDRANGNKQALWRLAERGRAACVAADGTLPTIAEIILAYRESGASDLPPSPRP